MEGAEGRSDSCGSALQPTPGFWGSRQISAEFGLSAPLSLSRTVTRFVAIMLEHKGACNSVLTEPEQADISGRQLRIYCAPYVFCSHCGRTQAYHLCYSQHSTHTTAHLILAHAAVCQMSASLVASKALCTDTCRGPNPTSVVVSPLQGQRRQHPLWHKLCVFECNRHTASGSYSARCGGIVCGGITAPTHSHTYTAQGTNVSAPAARTVKHVHCSPRPNAHR